MDKEVIIDPRSTFQYSSFYVKGLYDLVGARRISFSLGPFLDLADLENDMRFIVVSDGETRKYYIHANDMNQIKENAYAWCDVYGCVNADYTAYPKDKYPKLVSLCPSFAIVPGNKIFGLWMGIVCFASSFNAIRCRVEWNVSLQRQVVNVRKNIRHYWSKVYKGLKNRMYYSEYTSRTSLDRYIFFLSTLWYSDEWNKNDDGVNLRRANFIRACKHVENMGNVIFEGGFANRSYSNSATTFADCMGSSVTMTEWMNKTHKSALVFNTPAFWNCHGWKLGEYLAMGKCIISTQLSNDLPAPLIHGEHIHYVENTEESMREAVEYILSHPDYRHKLEQGARGYWEKYGTPEASLRLLGIIIK